MIPRKPAHPLARPPVAQPRVSAPPSPPMAAHLAAAVATCRSAAPPAVQPRRVGAAAPGRPSPVAGGRLAAPPLPPPVARRPPVAQPCCWPFSLCFGGGSEEEGERTRLVQTKTRWNGFETEPTGRTKEFRLAGTEIRIWESAAGSSEIKKIVRDLMNGGTMTVYRAVSAYHPQFKAARNGKVVPLGSGKSSFDTGASGWTAWQWDLDLAVSIASSASGMGKDDRIENVQGYDKNDDNFAIGVVLKLTVGNDEPLTFYNATEVQIHGPQNAVVEEVMKMSSRLQDYPALRHYYQKGERETLADLMP